MNLGFISSVANFSRGVGNIAELAYAFFGNTLSVSGRKRMMAKITGDDTEGRAKNNTLAQKQSWIMCASAAIIFTYDNY